MELGDPISYEVLERGTPVYASDAARVGEVKRVLAVIDDDIFDGIIISTAGGDRFVDADGIDSIHEGGVTLRCDAAEAARLPEPSANPAAMTLDATDATETTTAERARRVWNLISGKW